MSSASQVVPYFPSFLWDSWFAYQPNGSKDARLHVYDVYDNELNEIHEPCFTGHPIFIDLLLAHPSASRLIDVETSLRVSQVEDLFSQLQTRVAVLLADVLSRCKTSGSPSSPPEIGQTAAASPMQQRSNLETFPISHADYLVLRRYLIFLRFRNSAGYTALIEMVQGRSDLNLYEGVIFPAYKDLIVRSQLLHILRSFAAFLHGADEPTRDFLERDQVRCDVFVDRFRDIMRTYCWRLLDAEVCVGVASDGQEYILPQWCYGTLDEGFTEDPEFCDFFFPISPGVALYLLGTTCEPSDSPYKAPPPADSVVYISVGMEAQIDVHLRNCMILQTYPPLLIFSSLRSVSLSVSSYDEFRWINEHQDYSRLKMRCRQKFLMEGVMKTLVIRESHVEDVNHENVAWLAQEEDESLENPVRAGVRVFDLTDQVQVNQDGAVGFGTFSDVWKGVWNDPVENCGREVAIKYLRQVMVKNVKERLIRRLKAEVETWHKLCHRNVSQFFGIVQCSNRIGMVSPWYSNGTICQYVKEHPKADRLKLLIQVASGIAYLHSLNPPIVHGDLKGGNILIDSRGYAIITDFGLSKVMEEVSASNEEQGCSSHRTGTGITNTSFFAGSTRWMAPELILALIDDDENHSGGPQITTMSDVYAFGSVCLELATDQIPYAHRTNDHAVTLDIIRGVLPGKRPTADGQANLVCVQDQSMFWHLMESCWSSSPVLRPTMADAVQMLEAMVPGYGASSWNRSPNEDKRALSLSLGLVPTSPDYRELEKSALHRRRFLN